LADVSPVLLIGVAPLGGEILVVAGHGREGLVGDALVQFLALNKADDSIAAFDVMVQKIERLAGIMRLQPKGDLTEFNGERIEIHPINASADHVAQGGAESRGRWLLFPRAHDGQFGGDTPRSGEKNVSRTAGDISNAQIEQCGRRIRGLEAFGDQVVERVFDEGLDQVVRRVVGASRGTFPTLLESEFNRIAVIVEDRLVFEQAFVDRPELLHV
jgi:hypothetical protein